MDRKIKPFLLAVLVIFIVTLFVHWNKQRTETSCKTVTTSKVSPTKSSDGFQVPNIVHYNWYTSKQKAFIFKHWISVLSAYKILKPDRILIHLNMEPTGDYWQRIKVLPAVEIVHEEIPDSILGEKVKNSDFFTAASNIGRIISLLETGGIYLDFDVLIVQTFDELRLYPCTIGLETSNRVCGGIIICSKESPFLFLWANTYLDDFKPDEWAYNTGLKPGQLANRFPSLVHIENTRLNRPNYLDEEIIKIWGNDTWNWRENYAVHTWYRKGQKFRMNLFKEATEPNEDNIWKMNNTFAEICRYILKLHNNATNLTT